jgi:hypothetical protein
MTETPNSPATRPFRNALLDRSTYLLGLGFTTAVFVVSYFYAPPDVPAYSICMFKNTTGLDCPGCGLTRAFCSIAKGNVSKGFYFNATSPMVFALFGLWWLRSALHLAGLTRPARFIDAPFRKWPLLTGLVLIFISAWLVKLILHFPS